MLVAVAVDWEGRRQILAVELANRESRSIWRDFHLSLRKRGLTGVEFVVSDDHAGLKAAIREVLPGSRLAALLRAFFHEIRRFFGDTVKSTAEFSYVSLKSAWCLACFSG